MANQQDIAAPDVQAPDQDQVPGGQQQPQPPQPQPDRVGQYYDYLKKAGADVAPTLDSFKKTLSNDSTARQYYGYLKDHHFDAPPTYGSFSRTLGIQAPAGNPAPGSPPPVAAAPAQTPTAPPEHLISHTPIQDIRHLNDLANQPVRQTATSMGEGAPGVATDNPEDVARNKGYQDQYQKGIGNLATTWGTDPKATQRAIEDFPGEMDENRLKERAVLNQQNPVYYGRLKSADAIRQAVAASGQPDAFRDASHLNDVFSPKQTETYQDLQNDVAIAQEIMSKHGLSTQNYHEMLKTIYAPMINTLQPGLHSQYWDSEDKKLGLSEFQYAGLETEKMFQPGKYSQDMAILRENRGLDQSGGGEPNPVPQGKKGYAYDRGVENVLFGLENQGRQNTGQYISQRKAELGPQIDDMVQGYKDAISFETQLAAQQALQAQFLADPIHEEAAKLEEGQQSIDYAQTEDQRKFPLNYSDRATREVKDAMSHLNGVQGDAHTESAIVRTMFQGAGEQADNTMRFIKNTWINMLGSDQWKAENAASNIGHQALTDLAGYQGDAFSTHQNATVIDPGLQENVQKVFDDQSLDYEDKVKKATDLIVNNPDQVKANPLAGQQNLTGKAVVYTAANTIGQILGIADQSLLMGGLLGDASKAQQMANAFVPMYASTQNSLYEQALARGDEKPLLSSHLDAAIISLASMINPDAKVVKGMVGAETGVGKMIAGVEEDAWNKVLSTNKPLVDRMIAGTKATAKQLGLANLQYGLIVPSAQYVVHKNVLNEDPNLGDAIKDGLLQTSISMALPALLHGAFGAINATDVNPMQKYAMVELGLHPKENAELIDQAVEKGQLTPDRAAQIKDVIKHTGHILENTEGVKSDGTPMNEQEVADLAYQMVRKKVLEGKLKNAPDPQKPAIEQRINEIDQSVADLHTSEADKQKTALNTMLISNIDKIKASNPAMEGPIREAVKRNEPESVFADIHDEASQTKTVEGKEVSTRSETEDKYGKELVNKAFELNKNKKTTNGKGNENAGRPDQAQEVGTAPAAKPPEGAAPETTPQENAAPSFIHPTDEFRTWNLGDMEGKPEDEAAKKHLEGVVREWDKHPAGETGGEPFGDFVNRVIPAFDKVLKEKPNNTTIVTHSSVLKAMRVWDEMGRPDVEHLTEEQKKQFADKYNETETHNGDLETFKGDKGDVHVIRHGQTVDNEKNNFRSGDTPLTEKGVGDAQAVGQELRAKTGGDVPQIITSDLPRTIHSSNIIHDALQERSPEGEVPRPGTTGENSPVSGEGVGQGQQGEIPPGQNSGTREGQEPPGGTGGQKVVSKEPSKTGIAERIKKEREGAAGVRAPEPGQGATKQELVDHGRKLLAEGRDPEKVMQNFENNPEKEISVNAMSLAVAHLEQLAKTTDQAVEEHGEDSSEANTAKREEAEWAARVQPMQTEWSKIGGVQQAATEVDSGSVTSLKRAFRESSGKPLTEKQNETAQELRSKLKEHEDNLAQLYKERDELQAALSSQKSATFTEKTKKAADIFRKLKTAEFKFKDKDGNDVPIQKMGISWNDLVELGAKAIEKTGEIADGIAAILDKVKDADWYKALDKDDKDRFGKELEDHYANIADKKTATRIKALEKQLEDLQSGKVKSKGTQREETAREKELKDQIFEAKQNLGLIKPKATPTSITPIEKPAIDIATHFVDKKDTHFSSDEAAAIWDHTKEVIKTGGKEDFHGVVSQVAMDTGLTVDQVNHAIAQPKGGKAISDKIYAETYRRNQVKQSAEVWVKSANQSAQKKFWNKIIKIPSAIVTALHGSVAPITHAGGDLYRPTNWKSYFNFMLNSYKFSFGGLTDAGKASYEKAMNTLVKDPLYPMAKKAGVKCDPTDLSGDDYSKYQGVFGRLAKMGERGFNAMKPYRLEQFKKLYNGLSDQAKGNDDVRKAIANIANLSSGTTSVKTGQYTDVAIFAPKLVVSQYQRIFSEPWKALSAAADWKNATDGQKLQAKMVARHTGEMMATYLLGLAANQAILTMAGSKQKINFTNPLAPDWMRFKVLGKSVDASGGLNSSLRFVGSLVQEGLRANGVIKTDEKGKPGDVEGRKILQQAANKLSPLAGDIAEGFSTTDNSGNPLPWSSVKPSAGREKLTWAEYFESKSPIFIAEGFKAMNDATKANGMPKATWNNYLEGVVIGALTGATGSKIAPDVEKPKTGRVPR